MTTYIILLHVFVPRYRRLVCVPLPAEGQPAAATFDIRAAA